MAEQQPAATAAKPKKVKLIALVQVNLGRDDDGREKIAEARTQFEVEGEDRAERICKTMMGSTPAAVPATKENIKKYLGATDEE